MSENANTQPLENRLRAIEDRFEIYNLIASHPPSADTGADYYTRSVYTEDGVFAEVHTLAGVEDMAFFVSGGRVTVFLHPTAQDGRLSWEPLTVEIAVNTDDAVPLVRGPLRDAERAGKVVAWRAANAAVRPRS